VRLLQVAHVRAEAEDQLVDVTCHNTARGGGGTSADSQSH
jgi:hypothetical protein